MVGLKTKLTPDIQTKIGKYITMGMTIKNAALAAGIDESTFYRWMEHGEAVTSGKYYEFCKHVKESKALSEHRHLTVIDNAASEGDWKASAFILERRFPEDWGRIDRVNLSGQIKTQDEPGVLTDEIIEARNNYLKAVYDARKKENAAKAVVNARKKTDKPTAASKTKK